MVTQMNDKNTISTAEEAKELPFGQWVLDADDTKWCLVDTHMGFPQKMWMGTGPNLRRMKHISGIAYPVHLGDLPVDFVCPHRWGANECGHCYGCGRVIGERREIVFDAPGMATFRAPAEHNALIDRGDR